MIDLFGYDKTEVALERLRAFEPEEGYYLAFSGGKDSIVIKDLAIKSGVKFDAHYSNTTIDPPDLYHYMRNHHADVEIVQPEKPLLHKMVEMGFPPTRLMRWCCGLYKENGGSGRLVVTGIRAAESAKRAKRKMVESCYRDKTKHYLNLIIDWTDEDVWEYIKKHKLPYCKLYDEGWKRIGCIACPMSRESGKEFERYPKLKRAFAKAFDKMYAKRKAEGKKCNWDSGTDFFEWWLDRDAKGRNTIDSDQTVLFE